MKVTTTRSVYISKHVHGFNQINPGDSNPDIFHIVSGDEKYWMSMDYTKVGKAQIEIEFMNQNEMTANAVSALRKQKESVLAEAQAEATRIEGAIQNLLAITHDA